MRTKKIFVISLILVILLTGIFPMAYASEVEYVHLGGIPVGITLENPGLYICGKGEVVTENGVKIPMLNVDVYPGDYLVSINSQKIKTLQDLSHALKKYEKSEKIEVGILREGNTLYFTVIPAVDALTKSKKLGIVVQEGVSGVGTMTFVRSDGTFGALGHSIGGMDDKLVQSGKLFDCKIIGVKLPQSGVAGELQGLFDKSARSVGTIAINNDYGIFGKIRVKTKGLPEVRLGSRENVREGKAYIYTCLKGSVPQKYEVDIVRKIDHAGKTVKNMVIKVTDNRLLSKSGGIVQGMSGSPIVQDGYLIGAVTHVFLNDSTMGYGLYIDNMIEECNKI